MKTTTQTVNASTIITYNDGVAVSVASCDARKAHVAANVAGHLGQAATLGETRFGWAKGRNTWWTATVGA